MTDTELKAIEERAKSATPGPWVASYGILWGGPPESRVRVVTVRGSLNADASLVSHCREDVPALCAEVRRLRDVLALSEEQDDTLLATDVEENK